MPPKLVLHTNYIIFTEFKKISHTFLQAMLTKQKKVPSRPLYDFALGGGPFKNKYDHNIRL